MLRYVDDRYIKLEYMSGYDILEKEGSETQKRILLELLLNGPTTGYGLHKSLKMPHSTAISGAGDLKDKYYVTLSDEIVERGRNKKYYSLTLRGLSRAILWLHEEEDRNLLKMRATKGIENWPLLCPEFFNHWKDLTDDTKSPGASDYWFDFITHVSSLSLLRRGEYHQKQDFFVAIAYAICELWIETQDNPDRRAADALREIPEVWDQVSPTLYMIRDYHKETLKKADALLL